MVHFAIKKLEQMVISPVDKVVKAEDYQCIIESQQAITEIQEQAQRLYQQKKDEAYKAGESEAQKLISEQMLNSVAAAVEYLSEVEGKLVSLVIESVKKIIGNLHETDATVGLIKSALYRVRNESRVTLCVSSTQVQAVNRRIEEITADYPNIDFVDVVPDQALSSGACRVETELGSVDTSLDLQIDLLEKALSKNFNQTIAGK